MKSIKDLRESYNLITEKEENEEKKLVALVRAGLFDAKKLPALKKALDKTADKMTAQEKRMLLNLLDELMSQVITNQPVYQKVKQNLMKEEKKEYPVDQTIPSVVLLKRKAIRTFPNGQKVALYYAQSIDKYVSIPYNEIGINEEVEMAEGAWDVVKNVVRGVFSGGSENEGGSDNKAANEPKQFTPYQPKLRAKTSMAKRGSNRSSIDSRDNQLQRKALSINEFFKKIQPGVDDEGTEGHREYGGGGGITNPADIPSGIGGPNRNKGTETGGTNRKFSVGGSNRLNRTTILKQSTKKAAEKQAEKGFGKQTGGVGSNLKTTTSKSVDKPTSAPKDPNKGIESKPRTDLPKRQVDKKLETEKLPSAKSRDVTKIDTKITDKIKNADKTRRNPFAKDKPKPKNKSEKGKKGPGIGAALTGAALGALFGLGAGSTEAKPFTPGTPKLKATVAGPQRIGGGDAEKERMDQLQRKALKSQINETVDLDGNIFELNSIASKKVTSLYESLNQKNKKKMIEMMKENDESLEKVISFAVRQ